MAVAVGVGVLVAVGVGVLVAVGVRETGGPFYLAACIAASSPSDNAVFQIAAC